MDYLETRASFIVAAVSVVLYANSLWCGFVFDDLLAVKNNNDLNWETPWTNLMWNDFWGTAMTQEKSHKSYRPLTVLTFKMNSAIFGREPWSFHAVNTVLHAVVCVLYLKTCLMICKTCSMHIILKNTRSQNKTRHARAAILSESSVRHQSWRYVAYIATALFVTHPIHCEAVTGIVGRAELLSGLFMLLSILSYAKFSVKWLFLSCVFCVCAVASKEQGITVVAICAAFDIFIAHRLTPLDFLLLRKTAGINTGLRVAILSFVACLALLWRFTIMGGDLPTFTSFDNPSSVSDTPTRQLTYNFLLVINSWLLLNPSELLCDWTMNTIPLISEVSDVRNLATIAFYAVLFGLSWIAASQKVPTAKMILMGLALVIFPFLPASNLFFPVGFVVAERVLYVPSMGYCLLVSVGLVKLLNFQKLRKLLLFLTFTVILCFSAKTVSRNFHWESDYTLFQSGLQVTRNNAKIWNNVGHTFELSHPITALKYFKEAAQVQPDDIGSHMNVGRVYYRLKSYREAEISFRKAKDLFPKRQPGKTFSARIAPDHLQVFIDLGNILRMDKMRLNEADELYKEAISMRSDFVKAYVNRGEILMLLGRNWEAIQCYQDALAHSDKKDDVYFNLGVIHSQVGDLPGAIKYYTHAIEHNPNHIKALYNSAVIFQESGDAELNERAKIRVERVLKLEEDNFLALSLLGSIHLSNGNEEKAVALWNRVLEIRPGSKSALYNLAYMYSKKEDSTKECLRAIDTLLKFHPRYVKGLMLYGEVLLRKVRDLKAAQAAFNRVIEIDPKHVQARHNFCVAILNEGLLKEAEKCMQDVYAMAPDVLYVSDNLIAIRNYIIEQEKEKMATGTRFAGGEMKKNVRYTKSRAQEDEEEELVFIEPMRKKPPSTIPLQPQEDDEEEVVFVEPLQKKPPKVEESFMDRAKVILAEAQNAADNAGKMSDQKLDPLEDALEKIHAAVGKMKAINDEASSSLDKKCPDKAKEVDKPKPKHSKEAENAKQQALDLLDKLEAELL